MPELKEGNDPSGAVLLRSAIASSGLSARQFAMTLLVRDERTIRRWVSGEPMPSVVREWLARYLLTRGAG